MLLPNFIMHSNNLRFFQYRYVEGKTEEILGCSSNFEALRFELRISTLSFVYQNIIILRMSMVPTTIFS